MIDALLAYSLPIAIFGLIMGALLAAFTERYVRCLRRWMHMQQRMIRKPGYLKMHRMIGWLLMVTSLLLILLTALQR